MVATNAFIRNDFVAVRRTAEDNAVLVVVNHVASTLARMKGEREHGSEVSDFQCFCIFRCRGPDVA